MSTEPPYPSKYAVYMEKFVERHYAKTFLKKYGEKKWHTTEDAIESTLENPEKALQTEEFTSITHSDKQSICKLDFAVAGTKKSPKRSGNRVIALVDHEKFVCRVLLVYHKNDLKGSGSETDKWKQLVKENYPEYKGIL